MQRLLLSTALFLTLIGHAFAQTIDVTSGGSGTVTGVPQSFNETRVADATVLGTSDIYVSAMTLSHLWSGADGMALVGARIYDASTSALLCSHDTTVYNYMDNHVTVPIACTLAAGHTYRIGFFCGGTASDNSALEYYMPTFPYNDSHGLLQINAAKAYPADVYPTNLNYDVPLVTITYSLHGGLETTNLSGSDNHVFPNPCSNGIAINTSGSEPSQVVVYDLQSRRVIQQAFASRVTLNTEALPAGMYFYEVRSESGTVVNGKLVKE